MPTCGEPWLCVHFFEGQLGLQLDLLELKEVGRGAEGCWSGNISWLLWWGVCLPVFKGHSHLNGFWAPLVGLVSEELVLRNSAPQQLTFLCRQVGDTCSLMWCFRSPWATPSFACEGNGWKGCFKWSLLLLYKPSFKMDYKVFLNLSNTH